MRKRKRGALNILKSQQENREIKAINCIFGAIENLMHGLNGFIFVFWWNEGSFVFKTQGGVKVCLGI